MLMLILALFNVGATTTAAIVIYLCARDWSPGATVVTFLMYIVLMFIVSIIHNLSNRRD